MKRLADVIVYSPDNQVQLVVEVKSKKGATDEWAAKMRRNLLVHGAVPRSRFFLLALPGYFYLWRDNTSTDLVPADHKVLAQEALRGYLNGTNLEELSEQSIELLVSSWLSDLVGSHVTKEAMPELSWLFDSGLYDSVKGGLVETEAGM
jgi:hypothetical protein